MLSCVDSEWLIFPRGKTQTCYPKITTLKKKHENQFDPSEIKSIIENLWCVRKSLSGLIYRIGAEFQRAYKNSS
jgi:hypothetical protein